jgi:hypothetical protein
MSAVPARLCTAVLETTPAVVYTAGEGETARVMGANLLNNSTSDETYSLWLPEGGSPSDANRIAHTLTIGAGQRKDVSELLRQDIEPGWSLYGQASTAGVLTLVVSGTVFTEDE